MIESLRRVINLQPLRGGREVGVGRLGRRHIRRGDLHVALARVLEEEAIDTLEEARAYDGLDHEEVNRGFVEHLLDQLPGRGPFLDLGTGPARIPIELCREEPQVHVAGIDIARAMLAVAARNIAKSGLSKRIALAIADAKRLPFANGTFPAVISNSLVHHMAVPAVLLREAWRVVAPGGLIFLRDLIRPTDETALENLLESYATGATGHQRRMFADSMRAALTLDEIRCLLAAMGRAAESVQPMEDRYWIWAERKSPHLREPRDSCVEPRWRDSPPPEK